MYIETTRKKRGHHGRTCLHAQVSTSVLTINIFEQPPEALFTMQDLVGKATGDSPKRLKRKAKKFIAAKARLQYGEEVKEVSIQVQESEMKKMTNIVDRLVTTGSTQMRKYINVKIMDFKNKSREIFPDIPTESVVVFRDVHQMADIILESTLPSRLQLGMLGLMTALLRTKTKYSDTV